ncbi:MAG: hypothetical protein ACXVEE_33785 [Polyangiales bacterium]
MKRERSIWLSATLAVVAVCGVMVANDDAHAIELRCVRADAPQTVCETREWHGVGPFAREERHSTTVPADAVLRVVTTTSRHGDFTVLHAVLPDGHERSIASSFHCDLQRLSRALEAHLRDESSRDLFERVTGYRGALFLLLIALGSLAGAIALGVGYRSSNPARVRG